MTRIKEGKGGFTNNDFIGVLPEIVPESISRKFWKIRSKKEGKEVYFLPSDLSGENNDIFVIWLNGLSIAEQIEKTGGTIKVYRSYPEKKDFGYRENRFWLQDQKLVTQIIHKKSTEGYYLIKIEKANIDPDNSWRRAEVNEGGEILQTIFSATNIRYLENEMHISKKIANKILAIGNFQKNRGLEVWLGKDHSFNYEEANILVKKYEENSIIVKK